MSMRELVLHLGWAHFATLVLRAAEVLVMVLILIELYVAWRRYRFDPLVGGLLRAKFRERGALTLAMAWYVLASVLSAAPGGYVIWKWMIEWGGLVWIAALVEGIRFLRVLRQSA